MLRHAGPPGGERVPDFLPACRRIDAEHGAEQIGEGGFHGLPGIFQGFLDRVPIRHVHAEGDLHGILDGGPDIRAPDGGKAFEKPFYQARAHLPARHDDVRRFFDELSGQGAHQRARRRADFLRVIGEHGEDAIQKGFQGRGKGFDILGQIIGEGLNQSGDALCEGRGQFNDLIADGLGQAGKSLDHIRRAAGAVQEIRPGGVEDFQRRIQFIRPLLESALGVLRLVQDHHQSERAFLLFGQLRVGGNQSLIQRPLLDGGGGELDPVPVHLFIGAFRRVFDGDQRIRRCGAVVCGQIGRRLQRFGGELRAFGYGHAGGLQIFADQDGVLQIGVLGKTEIFPGGIRFLLNEMAPFAEGGLAGGKIGGKLLPGLDGFGPQSYQCGGGAGHGHRHGGGRRFRRLAGGFQRLGDGFLELIPILGHLGGQIRHFHAEIIHLGGLGRVGVGGLLGFLAARAVFFCGLFQRLGGFLQAGLLIPVFLIQHGHLLLFGFQGFIEARHLGGVFLHARAQAGGGRHGGVHFRFGRGDTVGGRF